MAVRSLNRVTLIGNLTRDPELRYTPQGTAVCTFGVATNRSWTTASGEVKESVQFHRIVAWQKLAELANQLLAKGKKVYLEGRLTYRTYVGKDEVERTVTELIMDDFVVFDYARRAQVEEKAVEKEEKREKEAKDQVEKEADQSRAKKDKEKLAEEKKEKKSAGKKEEEVKEEKKEDAAEEKVDPEDIPF